MLKWTLNKWDINVWYVQYRFLVNKIQDGRISEEYLNFFKVWTTLGL